MCSPRQLSQSHSGGFIFGAFGFGISFIIYYLENIVFVLGLYAGVWIDYADLQGECKLGSTEVNAVALVVHKLQDKVRQGFLGQRLKGRVLLGVKDNSIPVGVGGNPHQGVGFAQGSAGHAGIVEIEHPNVDGSGSREVNGLVRLNVRPRCDRRYAEQTRSLNDYA